jgi:Bacteriophage tail sheath protein
MTSEPSYPGVYIEETPPGGPIEGVATSIAAFVGGTASGPVGEPLMCTSFADFERRFGGLRVDLPLGYAVRDFYANGGTRAWIARAVSAGSAVATIDLQAEASASAGPALVLESASPGEWGNRLRAAVQHTSAGDLTPGAETFNLIVEYARQPAGNVVLTEVFLNLSCDEHAPRFVASVLEDESSLVRVQTSSTRPRETFQPDPLLTQWAGARGGADGTALTNQEVITALEALKRVDLFNLVCIPPTVRGGSTHADIYKEALTLCVERRAMLIVDSRPEWGVPPDAFVDSAVAGVQALGLASPDARNACIYAPCVRCADPLAGGQVETFVPCGIVAGVMARMDGTRGVWKAPAGLDAYVQGVQGLQANLTEQENGTLSRLGVNCLREFPGKGIVIWGARTLSGADQLNDEYKYVPVRRLALYIEESLSRGTQWAWFEPNDAALWARIRSAAGAFLHTLFRDGAFQGSTPRDAYFVKCDADTTTRNDIDLGVVNIVVGFAPLKPAEFVIIRIGQFAGQSPE